MTENNVAAQAGDEPMRAAFEVWAADKWFTAGANVTWHPACGEYEDREYQAAWEGYQAGQVSPRATTAVTEALQVCVKALEFRKERSANDEFALNLARIALAEAPRATADVERDAARYRWLLDNYARGDGYTDIDAALNEGEPEKYLSPAIDAAIATTKPGA